MNKYQAYLDFRNKYQKTWGYTGDYKKGEIELLTDVSLFSKCEEEHVNLMVKLGVSSEDAKKRAEIGIRDENRWGVVVCEPVKTPTGALGTFTRFISWGQLENGMGGIVIIPETSDNKFVFTKTFKNASRRWGLEFPRGGNEGGLSTLELIKEELELEIGAKVLEEPKKIGEMVSDPSIVMSNVNIYKVTVEIAVHIKPESMEAIKNIVILNEAEIKKAIQNGEIYDGFTLSALQLLNTNG